MTEKYAGECVRGPYDGKILVHWSTTKPVYVFDGVHKREHSYEYFDGIWRWNGPAVPKETT